MFDGVASDDKDPRKSTHVEQFPLPELAPLARKAAALQVGS